MIIWAEEGVRMNVRYRVTLSMEERELLQRMVAGGMDKVRRIKRAQVLLAADAGSSDEQIARIVSVGASTVYRTKRRFVEDGLEASLSEEPRCGARRKLSVSENALLIATACSDPPAGCSRWTLELLAGEIVRLTEHTSVSKETIRRRLVENKTKPWLQKMWCVAKVNAEYIARMEDVLSLYAQSPDEQHPVVCFDETPRQLIGEARVPIKAEPGKPARYDYEYVRNGTANIFMFVDAHRPWRHAKVTDRRTSSDFAECMRDLVDTHYPKAERIRVVLDNLSTHTQAALYESFEPAEARRILDRLEFHYTPKHGSWLNMVEIEIGVMAKQCLDRRIPNKAQLIAEVAEWERRRNAQNARIHWLFDVTSARQKLTRSYPVPLERQPLHVAA
jgi:transposase